MALCSNQGYYDFDIDYVWGLLERRIDLLLGGFEESGSVIHEHMNRLSLSEIDVCRGGDDANDVDPGLSILEVGASRKDKVNQRGSVVMDPAEFVDILWNVIMSVKSSEESKDVIVNDKGNVVSN